MSKLRRPRGKEAPQELHRLPRVSVQELNIAAQFLLTASSLIARGAEEACIKFFPIIFIIYYCTIFSSCLVPDL